MAKHREIAVAGVTRGLIGLGQSVTWEARHFLIPVRLSSRVTAFSRPLYFRDVMVSGPFKRFSHDHLFEHSGTGTLMRDIFNYQAPLGPLGRLADWLFLKKYMMRLLEARNIVVKSMAESSQWSQYIGCGPTPPADQT